MLSFEVLIFQTQMGNKNIHTELMFLCLLFGRRGAVELLSSLDLNSLWMTRELFSSLDLSHSQRIELFGQTEFNIVAKFTVDIFSND